MSKRVFFILCILCFSHPSHAVKYFALFDEDRVCSHFMREQANDPINIIRSFKKTSVVIPSMEFEPNKVFDFIFALKKNTFTLADFNDLTEEDQSKIETIGKIGKKFKTLAQQLKEPFETLEGQLGELPKKLNEASKPSYLFFSQFEVFQELGKELGEDIDPFIFSTIDEYKKQSYQRLGRTLNCVKEFADKEKDRLFIVVFPEAFFNFFPNPSGFGNFIPFFDDEWQKWIFKASQEIKNVVFFTNVVYADKEQKISNFDKNFEQFIKNSYNQKEILNNHYIYKNLKVIPIFNETFVLYKGQELGRYKKQFILDEDIPVVKSDSGHSYLHKKRLLYVPGTNDQKNIGDLFTIEICQDHVEIQQKIKIKTDFLVVQSASVDIMPQLLAHYEGTCIHSDIDVAKSNVYRANHGELNPKDKTLVKCQDEHLTGLAFQMYNLKII